MDVSDSGIAFTSANYGTVLRGVKLTWFNRNAKKMKEIMDTHKERTECVLEDCPVCYAMGDCYAF